MAKAGTDALGEAAGALTFLLGLLVNSRLPEARAVSPFLRLSVVFGLFAERGCVVELRGPVLPLLGGFVQSPIRNCDGEPGELGRESVESTRSGSELLGRRTTSATGRRCASGLVIGRMRIRRRNATKPNGGGKRTRTEWRSVVVVGPDRKTGRRIRGSLRRIRTRRGSKAA
jgi:hypothetical protein